MMNKKLYFTLVALISVLQASAQHYPDKPATHGMLIMGSDRIYASHLPMFHSPHDYQIILELKFSGEGMEKYLKDRKDHPDELVYTIEPETFVLPEMVKHAKKFKASIYRGHFERGGTMIAKDVPMIINQVIYYSQLKKDGQRPDLLKYILFGNDKEQFLAHQINAAPDFDEITSVKTNSQVIQKLNSQYQILEFNEKDARQKFSWKTNNAQLSTKQVIEFTHHQNLYIEFRDLD
jgi:hypothetical protein